MDIFFVLSGYLITNVIWREALDRGFSIARFYERRVRRIMPALIAVMIVVSAFAIALLLPIDLLGYAKSVFASLGFVANIYFWRDTDYFARLAEQKPLLHVWSLGVEEQFYILFPLIVVLCIRWRRSALLPLTSALVIISFLANVVAHRVSADNPAFFLLPTRAWEIGAGAVLALMPTAKISNAWLRHGLALLAAALIIVGLCFKDPPGKEMVPVALWVVLGATLAMHLGNAGGSWLTQGLSKAPLVWIGLISYSLYLWHWPILVFIRYYFVQTSLPPVEMAIAVMLMFALATLSWRYVERPFRNRSMPVGAVLTWVACGCILVAAASAAVFVSKGFPSRYNAEVARINAAVGTEYRCAMNEYIPFGGSRGCLMALPGGHVADATVALFGNSHAQMYAPIVTDILRENNQGGILVPMNGCLPLPDFNPSSACMALAAQNMREVENLPNIRVVILAMTWWNFIDKMYTPAGLVPRESESKVLIESLDRVIQELERRGITVVLVGPICSPGWDSASIVARKLAFHREIDEPLYLPQSAFMAKLGVGIEHYASRDDLIFIRPDLIQCKLDKCDYFRDGASIFADESHIAEDELPLFRPVFEPALKRALLQSSQSKH